MKQIIMPLEEYEEEKKKCRDNGVSIGIYLVLEHLRGTTSITESGYNDKYNCECIEKIEIIIRGDS